MTCEPSRFDQFKAALASLAANAPVEWVYAYLVDFDEEPDLRAINARCRAKMRSLGLDKPEDTPGIMSCFRSTIVLDAMQEFDAVAYLDSDIVVRGSLDELWDEVDRRNLKVMHRPEEPDNACFQAGIFVIGSGPETIEMMEDYDNIIQRENVFLREQEELYLSYKRHPKVELVPLDRKFNDWRFRPESKIWHCKARHFNSKVFQGEYQRWLRRANDKLGIS